MSYAHNKRKKNKAKFADLACYTFKEFCEKRGRKNPISMSKDEYDEEMYLWLHYKKFYQMDMTLQEKAWVANYTKILKEQEQND